RVGYNTMAQLERRLGLGLVITGGHPQGARAWRLKRTGGGIYADGFEYRWSGADHSAVIDELAVIRATAITGCFGPATLPAARGRSRITWHGLSLGMTRAQVLRRTKRVLPSPRAKAEAIVWEAKGFVRANDQTTFRSWTAELGFEHGRLSSIDLSCE